MKRLRLKKTNYKNQVANTIFLILILIGITTIVFLNIFNKAVNPRILEVATQRISTFNNLIMIQTYSKEIMPSADITDIITIVQNSKEEILTVDFKLGNAYEILRNATINLQDKIAKLELGQLQEMGFSDPDLSNGYEGLILNIPIGVASKSIYFANLGPRIPVKIRMIGNVIGIINTKITDYGINNALVEIYMDLTVTEEIMTPVTFETIKTNYEVLIASKVIQGIVPSFYGGLIQKNSEIINVPVE